jgi:hypothetical protein
MNKTTIMTTLLAIEMVTVLVLGLMFAFEWRGASLLNSENLALQKSLTGMQKRTEELEDDYASMLRNATQFHDELEACQREKGIEWRERMEATCAGYRAEVAP